MDFVIRLPYAQKQFESIWIIVDRMTMLAHFLPTKSISMLRAMLSYVFKSWLDCVVCLCLLDQIVVHNYFYILKIISKRAWHEGEVK